MEIRRSTLNSLKVDTQRLDITLELNAWKRIVPRCKGVQITAGGKIQNQARVAESWIFPSESVAASEQTDHEGASTIARFFEPGDFCANPSASIRCSLNRQFSNECCVPHLGHPNHSPLKHPSKSMERQERRTKIPFRFFVTEPRSVGPRYGDLCFDQQRLIPAKSAKDLSNAPSSTKSPCRGGGPTMRGGLAALIPRRTAGRRSDKGSNPTFSAQASTKIDGTVGKRVFPASPSSISRAAFHLPSRSIT